MVIRAYKQAHNHNVYIETHDVELKNGEFIEKTGKPLTMEAYKKLFSLAISEHELNNALFKSVLIDPRIIALNEIAQMRTICWYDIAQKRNISIAGDKVYNVWMPAMVYVVKNGKLQLFALKSNRRPATSTVLHRAPLPNIVSDQGFCWGNIDTEKETQYLSVDEEIKAWDRIIWHTNFDTYHGGSYIKIYKELEKTGKRYPKKELNQLSKNLGDILKS